MQSGLLFFMKLTVQKVTSVTLSVILQLFVKGPLFFLEGLWIPAKDVKLFPTSAYVHPVYELSKISLIV